MPTSPNAPTVEEPLPVEIRRDIRIPTPDPRVSLSADVCLPIAGAPVPALVSVLPYRKDLNGQQWERTAMWMAERGYASVLADLRGCGSSDGQARPKCDPGEGDDAVAVIEWAAEQPWCDGNIGMWGASSGGITTLRAGTFRPPHLRAIMPIVCPTDPERHAFQHDGARVDLHQRALWGGMMIVQQLLPPLHDHTSAAEQERWRTRVHEAQPFLVDLARAAGDPELRDRVIDAGSIRIPTFCIGGWQDLYADAMTEIFESVQAPAKLLIGPWAHVLPDTAPFGAIDFHAVALRWWDHWLRGIDTGFMDEPPVTTYIQGHKPEWRTYHRWPPAKDDLTLSTASGTTLRLSDRDPAPTGVIAEYRPDPTIGILSGLWGIPSNGFGVPQDQHDDDVRALTATSEPLEHGLLMCGRGEVTVWLANDVPADAVQRLVVKLTDVDPDGRSMFITAGTLCPGTPSTVHRIRLRASTYRLRPGHRLRVVISDSDFPRLVPLPDPRPIQVAGVGLKVPALDPDEGTPVDIPTFDNGTAALLEPGRDSPLLITRDPVRSGIDIRLAWNRQRLRTSDGHVVETRSDLRAKVCRGAPDAAVTSGHHVAVARMTTGEVITVTADVRCTQTVLWARGEIDVDGLTTFSKIWEAPLTHTYEPKGPDGDD